MHVPSTLAECNLRICWSRGPRPRVNVDALHPLMAALRQTRCIRDIRRLVACVVWPVLDNEETKGLSSLEVVI